MAVFRNVMAFLGLDDDDQMYDDEAYYDDDIVEERPDRSPNKTIALDDRLTDAESAFGFSADVPSGEMGGVGAVRPLRPVTQDPPEIPDALKGGGQNLGNQDSGDSAFGSTSPLADSTQPRSPFAGRSQFADSTTVSHVGDVGPAPSQPAGNPAPAASTSHERATQPTEKRDPALVTHAKPRLHIPSSFDDASKMADDFRSGAPVVMNLSKVEKPTARRLVDFASGVCYVLSGGMERVAANVYLLTPAGVDVSADDRRRMQERGFDR